MRAVQLSGLNQLGLVDLPDPLPTEGEAIVALRTAALNHRDVWMKSGQYAGLKFPCTPGSDGAGVVTAVGAGAAASWVGREVILNPSIDWGEHELANGVNFSILGPPRIGTLAEKVAVPVAQLTAKPAHLAWDEAAALPLAGLTAFRAVFSRAQLRPGERLLVTGIGGGVALSALQFAVAHGAEAWVTSSSPEKISCAIALGARGGFDYTQAGWIQQATKAPGWFDVIVDGAGGGGFGQLADLAAQGGRIVFYGATRGNVPQLPLLKREFDFLE